MNAEEMFYNVHIELGSYDKDAQYPNVDSDDIKYYLNKAQLNYVRQKFDPVDPRLSGFEQSQRVIDELKPLYTKNVELDTYYAGGLSAIDTFFVDRAELPEDLMFLVSHRPEVTYTESNNQIEVDNSVNPPVRKVVNGESSRSMIVSSKLVQSDDVYKLLGDPFNKTSKKEPIVDINENYIDIYTDETFFIERVIINYIRQPQKVIFISSGDAGNQSCELPDFTHEEIVEIAVKLLLKKRRTQTNTN